MDASSAYQDSLPLSSDALLAELDAWGLPYRLFTHAPLRTVEDSKAAEHLFVQPGEKALRIKNLYLRDKKKRNHLVTLEQSREIDLKALGVALGAGNLSFGSEERLFEHLGIRPGAVSPLAMVNGVKTGVSFHLDPAAREAEVIYMHPLVNDRTVAMSRDDLFAFLERIGCPVTWLA
ncbi:prolyl-tRNA synthetase associated domain-containing protein [Defluviimonas sp. D31]|uniref:prolyl-tRNA synthetase associated domain-containing protein n=1 Tax=Defluviimonas sp. D31 TaxID=3083253 RepID=UPI00296F4E74|nr:prolyl-tRNA synthetase associated domain-containing protein [Defluviimonas sp. D31]MDW4550310.1 prolyl-tRNA synthetase associated domain-containing protein [Defluviimonas sp. D31]